MYHHARESTVLEWAEPRRVRDVVEEWTPYLGKRGGEGWQWSGQGRPIYQKEKPTRRRGQGPAESGQAYDAEPNRTVPDTIRTSDTPESLEKQVVGGESGQIRTDPDIASEIAKLPAGHLDGTRQNPLFANSARGVEGNWQADHTHAVVPIAQIISSQPVVWDKILGKSDAEIVAVSHGDQYVLIDGNHAVVQALLAGETTVPVTVYPEKRDATFDASTPRGTAAIQRHVESWTPQQKMSDWKANGVRGASFKSFFGDWEHEPETASKVVDQETGEPLVVVHGSPQEFDEFRYRDLGFHFGSKEQAEHLGEKRGGDWKTRQFYLDIRNPLRLPDQILWGRSILDSGFGPDREDGYDNSTAPQGFLGRLSDWRWRDGLGHDNAMGGLGVFTIAEAMKLQWDIQDALPQKHGRAMSWNEMDATQRRESLDLAGEMVADALRKKGYDGIVYYNKWEGGGGDSWIAFEPQQIKAVENRGTFDPTPNMYESRGRVREQVAFEAWDESKYRRDEGGRFASKDAAIAAVGGQDIGPDEEVEVVVDGWVSWTGPKREADQMVRDQWDETQDLRGISIHRPGQGPRAPERVETPKLTHTPAGIPIPEYSHDRDHAPGGAKWRDPPEVMYHATFSAPEIEREGFRPLNELDPRHRVLGGSDTTSMSLTTRENAELYRDGLATARQLAQGQVPWERHNAHLLAHHFGVQDAEFDRLWAEQDRRTGVPDDQRWYDLMQGVSFAGRKFPLFITGGWTDTLKNAPGPPRLVKVARGSAEQFSYNPGETEWKVLDPEKLRVLGVESAVVAATATPRRIAESFDESKVKRDKAGKFSEQEGRGGGRPAAADAGGSTTKPSVVPAWKSHTELADSDWDHLADAHEAAQSSGNTDLAIKLADQAVELTLAKLTDTSGLLGSDRESESLEAFDAVDPETAATFRKTIRQCLDGMTIRAMTTLARNVGGVHFHPDYDAITVRRFEIINEDLKLIDPNDATKLRQVALNGTRRTAAMWLFRTDDERKGVLHLDGGRETQVSVGKPIAEVYRHELSHALDGRARHSNDPDWVQAWQEEIKQGGNLSDYAATEAIEGWAEFGRLALSTNREERRQARENFPRCYAYWKKQGFV